MTTNDLKEGARVLLANGEQGGDLARTYDLELATGVKPSSFKAWEATIKDNLKGNIRLCEVEGFETEIGSVYSHDILAYETPEKEWKAIDHTIEQLELRDKVNSIL